MTELCIRLLRILHTLLVLFVLFAWVLPFANIQWIHLFFVPAMILHWQTNNGACILTELEQKLIRSQVSESNNKITANDLTSSDLEGGFSRVLWVRIFGRPPSDRALLRTVYGASLASWSLTIWHLFKAGTL